MTNPNIPEYQIDGHWQIVRANEAFCRKLHCTASSLIGRDVRDLLPADWRVDFRNYVARALVGVGDREVTVPMVAPCGEQEWFKHQIEPIIEDGMLAGYRASVQALVARKAESPKRWWQWRPAPVHLVWDFENQPLARAS